MESQLRPCSSLRKSGVGDPILKKFGDLRHLLTVDAVPITVIVLPFYDLDTAHLNQGSEYARPILWTDATTFAVEVHIPVADLYAEFPLVIGKQSKE
jgi:hypothetical protein